MKSIAFRFVLLIAAVFALCSSGWAQKVKEKPVAGETKSVTDAPKGGVDPQYQRYHQIYESALNYNDYAVATDALYHLIALQPQNVALKDTLAAVYFQRGAWPQVVLLTTEILKANPENQGALELRAIANQSLNRAKESLEDYEALYKKTQNPYHIYEIAALQLSMKRFGECEGSIKVLLGDQSIKDKTIVITVQDGRSQDVPLPAAAFNLNGVLDMEQGKKDSAKAYFETAIKIYPEFLLAKNNLEALEKLK